MFGRKPKRVLTIEVDLGEGRYVLDQRAHAGSPQCARAKVVRGIALSTDPMHLDAWIEAMARDLAAQAQADATGREALERLIG
jgi:hypothetical protein